MTHLRAAKKKCVWLLKCDFDNTESVTVDVLRRIISGNCKKR